MIHSENSSGHVHRKLDEGLLLILRIDVNLYMFSFITQIPRCRHGTVQCALDTDIDMGRIVEHPDPGRFAQRQVRLLEYERRVRRASKQYSGAPGRSREFGLLRGKPLGDLVHRGAPG